jgi:hypothetical protein
MQDHDDIVDAMEREHQCNYTTQFTTSAEPIWRITDRPYISKIELLNGFKYDRPDLGYDLTIRIVDPDGLVETESGQSVVVKARQSFNIKTGRVISALDYADKLEDLAIQIREAVLEMKR